VEYYQPIFAEWHLASQIPTWFVEVPLIRSLYWQFTRRGLYAPLLGQEVVRGYFRVVEAQLANVLKKHSIAYWLHAYRRLSPHSAGPHNEATTISIVRATLEMAVQKYAQFEFCNGIGVSTEVKPEQILRGKLMEEHYAPIRNALASKPQLVLTEFGEQELVELYQCEKLAYEIWRCGAVLRILGKGAWLVVDHSEEPIFFDTRTPELDRLVSIYDRRSGVGGTSATGTTFPTGQGSWEASGAALIPYYNVKHAGKDEVSRAFEYFKIRLVSEFIPNFLWGIFNLRGYYKAHLPFRESFLAKHNVTLDSVVVVLAAFLWRVVVLWQEDQRAIMHFWQRAYEGPAKRDDVRQTAKDFVPLALHVLESDVPIASIDVDKAIEFLELREDNRAVIDLLVASPQRVFLPAGGGRVFVDLAWVARILYNLYFALNPADGNFKGDALESVVTEGKSVLPTKPCISKTGEKRQVDASFDAGATLVIAECRAKARSFGIEKGDPAAYALRAELVAKALQDADEKAAWLKANPVGRNYDVSRFKQILPIGVTPFGEYIHTLDPHFWLTEDLPRVITPEELRQILDDGSIAAIVAVNQNVVTIS
jgi:hypothetical protein